MNQLARYLLPLIICFNMLFVYNNVLVIVINILLIILLGYNKKITRSEFKLTITIVILIGIIALFSLLFHTTTNKIYYIYQFMRVFSFFLLYIVLDNEVIKKTGITLILVMFFNSILVILYFFNIEVIKNFLTMYQQSILGSTREVFGYRIGGLFSFLDGGMLSLFALMILLLGNYKLKRTYKNIIVFVILVAMLFQARTPLLLFIMFIAINYFDFKLSFRKIATVVSIALLCVLVLNAIEVISYSTYVWLTQLGNLEGLESLNSLGGTIVNSVDEIKFFSLREFLFGTGRVAWEGIDPIQTDNGYIRNFVSIGLVGFLLSTYIYLKNIVDIKNSRIVLFTLMIFIIFNVKGTLYIGYPITPVFLFAVQYFKKWK